MPTTKTTSQPFSLDQPAQRVNNAVQPEDVRDIAVSIFHKMVFRRTHFRFEDTGFEWTSDHELHLAFYHTVNEMVIRMHYSS
jgi:hypothetical protein